jgi:hypothetical protein
MTDKYVSISTTEEMILNFDGLPKQFNGWRRYRIEYLNEFGHSFHEETLYVPPGFDIEAFDETLERLFIEAQSGHESGQDGPKDFSATTKIVCPVCSGSGFRPQGGLCPCITSNHKKSDMPDFLKDIFKGRI